jgi:predicted HicB family RNase H-like nuclease
MKKTKPPATKKSVAKARMSHREVLDFVTGGAAAQANRHHAASARTAQHAARSARGEVSSRAPRVGDVRLTLNIRKDLHRRLQTEATRRRTTVGEVVEQLLKKHTRG